MNDWNKKAKINSMEEYIFECILDTYYLVLFYYSYEELSINNYAKHAVKRIESLFKNLEKEKKKL